MEIELRYLIQWILYGARGAKDPRLQFFPTLSKQATIDPHTLQVQEVSQDRLEIKGTLRYSTPNLAALKKKKFVMNHETKVIKLSIVHWKNIDRKAILPISDFTFLPLDTALALFLLYIIFTDNGKYKLFKSLIKTEGEKNE